MRNIAEEIAMGYQDDLLLWPVAKEMADCSGSRLKSRNIVCPFPLLRDPVIMLE